MTRKGRKAIIQYWLNKKCLDMRPLALKRFYFGWRVRAIVALFCILMSSNVLAAETKSTSSTTVLKSEPKLLSTESFKAKFEEIKAKMSKVGTSEAKTAGVKALDPKSAAALVPEKVEKPKPKVTLPDVSKDDEKAVGEAKEATGTIVARNNYGMAVEYAFDKKNNSSEEIWVNFNKKVKVSGAKGLSQLGEGDTIRIQYKVTKAGQKIILQGIELLKKKPVDEPLALVSEGSGVAL